MRFGIADFGSGRWVAVIGLPIIIAGSLAASLRLSDSNRRVLALLIVSCGIGTYGAEVAVSFKIFDAEVILSPADIDKRSKLEVILAMRKEGIQAYPPVNPFSLLAQCSQQRKNCFIQVDDRHVLPLGGVADATVVLCNESGQHIIIETDEYGYNNPSGYWSTRSHSIAIVGDSFVYGYCLPTERTMVARVRDRYPATVGLGGGGNGPLSMLGSIREYLKDSKPSVVLWTFVSNDLEDLDREKRNSILARYLDEAFSQNLREHQDSVNTALATMAEQFIAAREITNFDRPLIRKDPGLPSLVDIILLRHLRQRLGLWAKERTDFPLYGRVLAEARRTVESWGGHFYLVLLPSQGIILQNDRSKARQRDRVRQIAEDMGVSIIDIYPNFEKGQDPQKYFGGAHFSEEGDQIVADTIVAVLLANHPELSSPRE